MIERAAGNVAKKSPIFSELLKKDFDDMVIQYQKVYNVIRSEAYASISKALINPKYHSVSDLVGGITGNQCCGGYKHSVDYWSNSYKLASEAFAHFYEATVRNDIEKLNALKVFFQMHMLNLKGWC